MQLLEEPARACLHSQGQLLGRRRRLTVSKWHAGLDASTTQQIVRCMRNLVVLRRVSLQPCIARTDSIVHPDSLLHPVGLSMASSCALTVHMPQFAIAHHCLWSLRNGPSFLADGHLIL